MHINSKNYSQAGRAVMRSVNWLLIAVIVVLTACDPFEKQRTEQAEKTRIKCLDEFCQGDTDPKHDLIKESVIKVNGQWFIGPQEYFKSGSSSTQFVWWEHRPLPFTEKLPSEVKILAKNGKGYDFIVEIFLHHHDGVMHRPNIYAKLQQAEVEGRLISKSTPRSGLEVWHINDTDGITQEFWYVANAYVNNDPSGAVVSCRGNDPKIARCTTGFVWKPGISADIRFRALHALDWPEIYQETIRILQLLKKA